MNENLLNLIDACQNTGSGSDFEALRQAITEQTKQIFALTGEVANKAEYAANMHRMNEAQARQIEALQADAERYRWLRDMHNSNDGVSLWHVRDAAGQPIEAGGLDAAIAAARKGTL
jgi:hypothetical protein